MINKILVGVTSFEEFFKAVINGFASEFTRVFLVLALIVVFFIFMPVIAPILRWLVRLIIKPFKVIINYFRGK